jgi:hypothetical protein
MLYLLPSGFWELTRTKAHNHLFNSVCMFWSVGKLKTNKQDDKNVKRKESIKKKREKAQKERREKRKKEKAKVKDREREEEICVEEEKKREKEKREERVIR